MSLCKRTYVLPYKLNVKSCTQTVKRRRHTSWTIT